MSSTTPTSSRFSNTDSKKNRYLWMDILRGSAILLVVLFHAYAAAVRYADAKNINYAESALFDALIWVNEFFQSYRMPTLMLLSGILLQASFRKPLARYYEGKVRGILWPFLGWQAYQILYLGSILSLFEYQNWIMTTYLWYLSFLFVLYIIAPTFRFIPSPAIPIIFFTAMQASVHFNGGTESQLTSLLFFGIFFGVGNVIGVHMKKFMRLLETNVFLLLLPMTAFVGASLWGGGIKGVYLTLSGLRILMVLVGILGLIGLVNFLSSRFDMKFLKWAGKNSIVFYVVHFPVQQLVGDIFIHKLPGIAISPTAYWVLISGVSIGVCSLFVALRKFSVVEILFVAPRSSKIEKCFSMLKFNAGKTG
ncbi:acyltransferase [Dermabacteraceae bacterium TAE3-ERU5]|nr:acyltransferase [Dermabacteraceae bacterium TAE3-ERU5]